MRLTNKWKCCKKEPSETGKKVLCQQQGDLYVAMRLGKYYVPIPFADHYFCKHLCFPETWSEIDFPEGLTGHIRIGVEGNEKLLTLSELEIENPQEFKEFFDMIIESIGTLKRNDDER